MLNVSFNKQNAPFTEILYHKPLFLFYLDFINPPKNNTKARIGKKPLMSSESLSPNPTTQIITFHFILLQISDLLQTIYRFFLLSLPAMYSDTWQLNDSPLDDRKYN